MKVKQYTLNNIGVNNKRSWKVFLRNENATYQNLWETANARFRVQLMVNCLY